MTGGLPLSRRPLTAVDRDAGYWWQLSIRQVELSRTLVFDVRGARSFFEASCRTTSVSARPEDVSIVFARRVTKRTREPFRTRIVTAGSDVRIEFHYKHARVKQYLKDGRGLRIETVINHPRELGVARRLHNLPDLVAKSRQVNQRLLMIEQPGQSCVIGSALFERIHQPYNQEGQRTGALRFGDSRATALAGALCHVLHAVTGFTNKTLHELVAGHLGRDYSQGQMSYDLRRLRLHGLIQRLPRSNTYHLTSEGIRVAVFYTKLQTASGVHFWTPTSRPPASKSAAPSPRSNTPSPKYVKTHASPQPHNTRHNPTASQTESN